MFLWLILAPLLCPATSKAETSAYAPPTFRDQERTARLVTLLPEVDRIFDEVAAARHIPAITYGVLLDDKLVHARSLGFANLERKIPAASDTRFRIASMTKSFVALAALRLRDEGKLRLDDPVANYLPELQAVRPLTADSPVLSVRQLMTMSTGLPEDNPWGDQQMAISAEALRRFVRDGLSFSTPAGTSYEYSNLGFVLLGQVVSKAAGVPFQKYITEKILTPLGMTNTVWEYADVPNDKLALGYRWEHDMWRLEPILHDGEGAACGGLITTLDDFARYVAFHLDAWPARDDPDTGPVHRATVREMHLPSVFSGFAASSKLIDGTTPNPSVAFYNYGLGWRRDARGVVQIAHSGGLPGYGSNYRFAPDHGVAIIAFCNLTYGPMSTACGRAFNLLLERGALPARTLPASAILETRRGELAELIGTWDGVLGEKILADNFFLDRSRADWITLARETLAKAGQLGAPGPVTAENQLRGTFRIPGEKGSIEVYFTLTPERVPKVQELSLTFVPKS